MINLSASAKNEILRLKAKRRNSGLLFRLGVQPIGCLGLSYAMDFTETAQSGDQIYDSDDIQIVVDPGSLPYLRGLTIDYSEDLMGGGFRFRNPNASQNCSCGNSFAIKQ
ncbi:MAG: iron-sulfur cluster assembly accessory protein [Kovacikia sp.]